AFPGDVLSVCGLGQTGGRGGRAWLPPADPLLSCRAALAIVLSCAVPASRYNPGRTSMQAEIFAIGTELLMGELTDANSAWLAARLPALGIELRRVSLLGDHLATLSDAMAQALQGVDLIITTGGLGPTQDDLTREAMAAALHETPTVHAETLQAIERYFQQRG